MGKLKIALPKQLCKLMTEKLLGRSKKVNKCKSAHVEAW